MQITTRSPALFFALLLATVCSLALAPSAHSQSVPPRFTMQYQAIAVKIVERLDLRPGETFLAVAHPGHFEELMPHLRYEVMKAGGVDLGVMAVAAE